jgi:hypothetical protein
MWSIFLKPFSTHYFNSLKQDIVVESQKIKNKNQLIQSTLEVAILETSFLKHSQGRLMDVR